MVINGTSVVIFFIEQKLGRLIIGLARQIVNSPAGGHLDGENIL